jgi:hypothetical protein
LIRGIGVDCSCSSICEWLAARIAECK